MEIRFSTCLNDELSNLSCRGNAARSRTPAGRLQADDGAAMHLDPVFGLKLHRGLQAGGQRDYLCEQSGPLS